MQLLAHQAYGATQRRTASDKEIEYALFEQITEALESVAETETHDISDWADAISRNLQLWTVLATDLLSANNEMSDEIKSGLLYLSEFVRRTTMTALSEGGDIQPLIDVNRDIMAGLRPNQNVAAGGA